MAAGIEAGDEVIIPPYTFFATASAVVEANATPIFVDVERDTFNIDPAAIEAAITKRTRAIIPVHLGGLPCDMDAIMAIAQRHGLVVIEDAAHAHGSEYKGKRVGAIGTHGVVLVSVVEEPQQRRRRDHHDQRRRARRALPLDPQLRPHSDRRVVRAPCDERQLPPERVCRRGP
jgi:hypothetical protein